MKNEIPRIKILVACHKADPAIRQDEVYMPIQVGKALHLELDLGYQCDNTGDNISDKNDSYCELTALYWAWKNLQDVDYIGLCHYRRYFNLKPDTIESILTKHDVVLPTPISLGWTVLKELALWTSLEDVYILIDQLIHLYPKKRQLIIDYFFKNNQFSRLNMIIADTEVFNNYCSFIFRTLFEFEQKTKPLPFKRQIRKFGYIGEILAGLWIRLFNVNTKYVRLDNEAGLGTIRSMISQLRRNLAFNIIKPRHISYDQPVIIGLCNDGYSIDL